MITHDLKIVGVFFLVILAFIFFAGMQAFLQQAQPTEWKTEEFRLVPAENPEDLNAYVVKSRATIYAGAEIYTLGAAVRTADAAAESAGAVESTPTAEQPAPERESTTNVQVAGIDEPDILKIGDGKAFFQSRGRVKVIDAFPPEEAEVLSKIPTNWGTELLKTDNVLILLEGRRIVGYDVSNPEKPEEAWSVELNGYITDAREKDGKIYAVVSGYRVTCPYYAAEGVIVPCMRYYYPTVPLPAEVTYTVLKIDGESGEVEESVALIGTYDTTVYMSENAIYFTYRIQKPYDEVLYDFILEKGDEFLPEDVVEHLKRVNEYDISIMAKIAELQIVLYKYYGSIPPEEQSNVQNRIEKALEEYMRENGDKIDRTGIAKISLDDLSVEATGEVPGHLLNQWSMDEYEGYLRVATTTSGTWRQNFGNNLYILDGDLDVVGKIEGLEEGERIYAVRFMGEKAYVVTYKETDPLLVLDLSDPKTPRVLGELKIPGFSTYLHPIGDNHMIGVGRADDWKVKVSLFDVSDPENPVEKDVYYLSETWSDVIYDHHAFLWDAKHDLLILPAGTRYYLLRVRKDEKPYIEAVKIVEFDSTARRAAYMDDYAYLFSDGEMAVVDEVSGKEVKRLRVEDAWYHPPIVRPEPVGIEEG
ncbi:MAG: hypothetical protein PWP76_718 [Candidatus Diapherotrites archaeon]|nr:hypothetical protein [Candidatus Diapherotrites archaeon]